MVGAVTVSIGPPLVGLAMTLFGSLTVAAGWRSTRIVFRCYERGVVHVTMFGRRELRDNEVGAVAYCAVRQYTNSIYSGTRFTLSLVPLEARKQKSVHYTVMRQSPDSEIERLRDRIAATIAERMQAEFSAGRPIAWTPHLRILQEGIAHFPLRLLFRARRPVIVPFESITWYCISRGRFRVWTSAVERSVITEETGDPNFFAGLALLENLTSGQPWRFPALRY
jgi:hypothetical protein